MGNTTACTEGKGEGIVYTSPEEAMRDEGANPLDETYYIVRAVLKNFG